MVNFDSIYMPSWDLHAFIA